MAVDIGKTKQGGCPKPPPPRPPQQQRPQPERPFQPSPPPPPVLPGPCCPPTTTLVLNNTIVKSADSALKVTEGYFHGRPAYFIEFDGEMSRPLIVGEDPIVVKEGVFTEDDGSERTGFLITINDLTGATSSSNGKAGSVPAPISGDQGKFLRGDGTWATITIPETAQSDWNEQDSRSASYIKHKPDIDAMVAAATTEVVEGLNVSVTESVGADGHKIYKVSASGGSGTSVQSDWNQTNPVEPDYIKNKPEIPAAQVNADWDANSGVAEILHKPGVFTGATSSANGTSGFVPAPTMSDVDKVLCGDGTWKDYSNSMACTVAEMDGWLDEVDHENDSVEEGENEGEDNGR